MSFTCCVMLRWNFSDCDCLIWKSKDPYFNLILRQVSRFNICIVQSKYRQASDVGRSKIGKLIVVGINSVCQGIHNEFWFHTRDVHWLVTNRLEPWSIISSGKCYRNLIIARLPISCFWFCQVVLMKSIQYVSNVSDTSFKWVFRLP